MSSEHGADSAFEADVVSELRRMRGSRGRLTVQKFALFPNLVRVCGDGDLLDAFLMFRRELQRYATGSRNEAALAWSILGDADSVLDRLNIALEHLDPDGERDQRTARRWSDAALAAVAKELVFLAQTTGRLGRELLHLELHGDVTTGLHLVIDQMTSTELGAVAPEVTLWRYTPDGKPVEARLDLEEYGSTEVTGAEYTMRRHRLQLELPVWFSDAAVLARTRALDESDEARLLAVTIKGRAAPVRTVSFEDRREIRDPGVVRFEATRGLVQLSVTMARLR